MDASRAWSPARSLAGKSRLIRDAAEVVSARLIRDDAEVVSALGGECGNLGAEASAERAKPGVVDLAQGSFRPECLRVRIP